MTSSCGKSSVDGNLQGKWKLVSLSGGPVYPRPAAGEILTLLHDRTYEIRYNDSIMYSGMYHVGHLSTPPRPVLYFTSQEVNGFWIDFNKDTLVLSYAGAMIMLYTQPVSRYVRVP